MIDHSIRTALPSDIPALRAMQQRSMTTLGVNYYMPGVPERFISRFGTMDFAVVDEGHYFVCVDADGHIAGSGGWSRRPPGYDGVAAAPLPADVATVRGVFT
jgi:hypothetical protein